MKKYATFFLVCILFPIIIYAQTAKQNSFFKGEKIVYRVHYGFISAGEVTVEVDTAFHRVDGHVCYRAHVNGKTVGAVGLFSKIDDHWTSYIDTTQLLTHKFIRDQRENDYSLYETTEFDRENQLCYVSRRKDDNSFEVKPYRIKSGIQDMVSTYFQLRNLDLSNIHKNDLIAIDMFLEDTTYHISVKCLGRQKIKSEIGKLKCIAFAPIFPEAKNSIFAKEDPVKIWLTEDRLRIPVKIMANTKFGAVEVDLENYNLLKKK